MGTPETFFGSVGAGNPKKSPHVLGVPAALNTDLLSIFAFTGYLRALAATTIR